MIRIYQIPIEIREFPDDGIGDNGDVAVNVLTSEVRKKLNGTWIDFMAGLEIMEGTSTSTPSNPIRLDAPCIYLGRTVGGEFSALYIWSVDLQEWIGIVTP